MGGENVLPVPFGSTGSEYDTNLKTAIKLIFDNIDKPMLNAMVYSSLKYFFLNFN